MPDDRPVTQLTAARRRVRAARRALREVERPGGPAVRGRRLVAVLAVVALTLAGVAGWQYASAPRRFSDAEFIAATTERVGLLIAADSDDPGRAGRILSGATGAFGETFAQSADAYSQFVASAHTQGDGSVDAVAIARRQDESALMLVAASARVATSTGRDAEPAAFRMRVLMSPEDGVLKIAAVEVLQ